MKAIIPSVVLILSILLSPTINAQTKVDMSKFSSASYQADWEQVTSFEKKRLPKSALSIVEKIVEKARAENNPSQLVKALLHKAKYIEDTQENGRLASITLLEDEVSQVLFPAKQLIHSILGNIYQTELSQRYWRIRNRTEVQEEGEASDINLWSIDQFVRASTEHYLASLEQKDKLLSLPSSLFQAVLREGKEDRGLRPSVYDFLAHRAIDHFMNDRNYLAQPKEPFLLNDPALFADAKTFSTHTFQSPDEQAYKYQALRVFQEVLGAQLDRKEVPALVDADLKRLKFAQSYSVIDESEKLYLKSLQALQKKYDRHSVWGEISIAIADFHYIQGNKYIAGTNDVHQWELKQAVQLCEQIIEREKGSYAAKRAKSLKGNIEISRLEATAEKVYLPGESGLFRMKYRNASKVYLKVVKVLQEETPEDYQEYVRSLAKTRAFKSWSYELPDPGDYQSHSVEGAIPPLPFGNYAIVLSNNRRFDVNKGSVQAIPIRVSQLSYLHQSGASANLLVVDRKLGGPVEGVKVSIYTYEYNRKKKKSERKFRQQTYSNAEGLCALDIDFRGRYFIALEKGEDRLFLSDQGHYNYEQPRIVRAIEKDDRKLRMQFFLDRAIYRPGQPVYFKGLVIEEGEQELKVAANEPIEVVFKDVNYQDVKKLTLTTNEYGTVNGQFEAPSTGLLGRMTIASEYGSTSFRVEEYKRPKFSTSFQPLTQAFNLGDEISVQGNAMGFAGNAIDGATVNFRVVREVNYPWIPWYYYDRYFPKSGEQQEIAQGEAQTDSEGNFVLRFKATADPSIDKKDKPAFIFKITADVTDISGETHSASKNIKLAYLGFETSVKLPDATDRGDSLSVAIDTRNLDGQFQAADGALEIFPLEEPSQPLLDRYWEVPDQHVLKESQFRKQFPHFSFGKPKSKNDWPRKAASLTQKVNSGKQKNWKIGVKDWAVGHYLAVFTVVDKAGNKIETSQAFFIYDKETKALPKDLSIWNTFDKPAYEPGEEIKVQLATGFEGMSVFFERQQKDEITRSWVKASPWGSYSYQVEESDRGNLHFKGVTVRQNRVFQFDQNVTIPWSNKELEIEYHTFRDKLRPGQDEVWKIVVKGPKKEAVAAEVAAAMYDASLDEFSNNSWSYLPHSYRFYGRSYWNPSGFGDASSISVGRERNRMQQAPVRFYERLNWFGFVESPMIARSMSKSAAPATYSATAVTPYSYEEGVVAADMEMNEAPPPPPPPAPGEVRVAAFGTEEPEVAEEPAVRTNLKETVFFMPDLRTDEDGNVVIQFKMNEALTKWKFLLFAHTKDLKIGSSTKMVQTQKELMVLPNPPRFLRETDEIIYTAKVSNLSEEDLSGVAQLNLFDASSRQPVDKSFDLEGVDRAFDVKAGQSALVSWRLKVPANGMAAVVHRVTAKAGNFADGEESVIPVLSNRMLVTEAITLPLRSEEARTFTFESLKRSGDSKTLTHHALSLEFTSNPAWYAVQSLPYLMEYPYECTEQIFNRFYANTLAAGIVEQQPAIEGMFEEWSSAEVFESALAKNEDLKQLLLEETPWVLDAQSEEQQRKNIALLFDLGRMKKEQDKVVQQLVDRQSANGGFSWFPGGRDSWYITQYLLEGIGHLEHLQVLEASNDQDLSAITTNSLEFIDRAFQTHFDDLQKKIQNGTTKLDADHLTSIVIHYLYTRSLFALKDEAGNQEEALGYYLDQAKKHWVNRGLYQQGMIALALHRYGEHGAAMDIIRSLEERAIKSKELGMYWKYNRGWFWHDLPIETHVLLLEAFAEVANDMVVVDEMKIWLLKNKQTNHWKTTKATASAIYGLLGYGQNWLGETKDVKITFPKAPKKAYQASIQKAQEEQTPGVGYYKVDFAPEKISKDYATVKVKNQNEHIVWGGLYWQYFEDLDAIKTFEETPLKLQKELFKIGYDDNGEVLTAIGENGQLKPGDKIKVRIELKVDRDMEYIHMKDMRASGLEPINVLSRYKWQDGLGYYESTKDVATHFFFDYLPKGTYVFEYPLRVVHEGQFSNGVTTIQSMYAPEFTSHSEGIKVEIKR